MKINEVQVGSKLKSGQQRSLYTPFDENRLIKLVQKNCSEYLSDVSSTGKLLYRGFTEYRDRMAYGEYKSNGPLYFIGKSREDRLPIGSNYSDKHSFQRICQLTCDIYLKLVGFSALRSNSTFVSSTQEMANMWGEKYIIFPINGFSFGYSKTHNNDSAAESLLSG